MTNREYKSDAQRGYDKNRFNENGTVHVIGGKSNLKTSVSRGVSFCPSCGAMILPNRDGYKCNSCGYGTGDSVSKFSPVPEKTKKVSKFSPGFGKTETCLELIFKKDDIRINYRILVSGYLRTKTDNIINAEIQLYFSGEYIQSAYTNNKGYYQFSLAVNKIGEHEIKVIYRGDSEYKMSATADYINIGDL